MFPGTKKGSLASRLAYQFSEEILPIADYCLDFHTGGASRFNAAQIRITENNPQFDELASIFNAPFTVYSKTLKNSYRSICEKKIFLFYFLKVESLWIEIKKSQHLVLKVLSGF